jgi:hypothetical protein
MVIIIKNNISVNNKMANKWITHVKKYASKNGMSYRDALRDPKCKAGYKKGDSMKIGSGGRASTRVQPVVEEVVSKEDLIDDLIGLIGANVEGLSIDDLYKLIQRPTLSLDDRDNRFADLKRLLQKYVVERPLTDKPSIRRELNKLSENTIDYLHDYYNVINAFNAMLIPVATSYSNIPSAVGIPVANAIPAPNPNYINIV